MGGSYAYPFYRNQTKILSLTYKKFHPVFLLFLLQKTAECGYTFRGCRRVGINALDFACAKSCAKGGAAPFGNPCLTPRTYHSACARQYVFGGFLWCGNGRKTLSVLYIGALSEWYVFYSLHYLLSYDYRLGKQTIIVYSVRNERGRFCHENSQWKTAHTISGF